MTVMHKVEGVQHVKWCLVTVLNQSVFNFTVFAI